MTGMIAPRRLLTPMTYAGTSGSRVSLPGVMISWIRSMWNRHFCPSSSKPTNCEEPALEASGEEEG